MSVQPRMQRPRSARTALVASLLIAAIAGAVYTVNAQRATNALRLDDIPQGVTARTVDDLPVFITRHDSKITVFLASVHHLGDRELWWCPKEKLFASPIHGELFDADGQAIGGPAHRGLTRFPAITTGGTLRIDTDAPLVQPRGNKQTVDPNKLGTGPWDTRPHSFCTGAVRSSAV